MTGLALATLFTGCTSNNSTERTLEQRLEVRQETSTPRNEERITNDYAPLSQFNDEITLIACDDSNEFNGVMETLHNRDNLRQKQFKMTFTDRDNYVKVTIPNRAKDGSITKSYLHIVKKDYLDDVLETMREKGIKYDILQMRGHQYGPMEELYDIIKDSANDHALFIFGGCNSYDIAEKYSTKNKPAIGGEGMQEASRNTYYLLRIIDLMNSDKGIRTWNDLSEELNKDDSSFSAFYFPK